MNCPGCDQPLEGNPNLPCPACGDPQGILRRFQRLLLLLLVALLAASWIYQTPFTAAPRSGSTETFLASLEQAWSAGWRARAALVFLGAIAAGALVVCVSKGRQMLAALRVRSGTPRPTPPQPRKLLIGAFLAAYVGTIVGEATVAITLMERPLLVLEGGRELPLPAGGLTLGPPEAQPGDRTLRWVEGAWTAKNPEAVKRRGPDRISIASLTSGQEVHLRWEIAQARLEVLGDARARVDGEAVGSAQLLQPGAVLKVGRFQATLKGPSWGRVVTLAALGKAVALLLLFLGVGLLGGKATFAELGITATNWKKDLIAGAGALWAFMPAYVLLALGTQWLGTRLGLPIENHPLIQAVQREGLGLLALVALQAVIFAPILEELLYRGFLLGAAQRCMSRRAALVLSTVAFSCAHVGVASLLPMLAVGFLLGGIRVSSPSDSILGSILAHALFNALTLTLLFATLA